MTFHWQAGVQPSPGKQGCIMHNIYLGRQPPSLSTSCPSFFFPPASNVVHTVILWDIPSVSWGKIFRLYPLPNSFPLPAYSLVGQGEKQRSPSHCANTACQQINICVFSQNHRIVRVGRDLQDHLVPISILVKYPKYSTI